MTTSRKHKVKSPGLITAISAVVGIVILMTILEVPKLFKPKSKSRPQKDE